MILIDGDTIAYRAAASCEPTKTKGYLEPEREAVFRADAMMMDILNKYGEDHIMYFSCPAEENFRYKVDPEYKSKRRNVPKPTHYHPLVSYLYDNWKCQACMGYEADDAIGINYMEGDIVAANDKDLLQIAGQHYNFVRGEFNEVSEYQGQYQLWHQMLEGDPSDSIVGVAGIGKVKAARYLLGLTPEEMAELVLNLYNDDDRFYKNLLLLKILRSEKEYHAICQDLESKTLKSSEKNSSNDSPDSVPSAEKN